MSGGMVQQIIIVGADSAGWMAATYLYQSLNGVVDILFETFLRRQLIQYCLISLIRKSDTWWIK